MWSVVDRNVVMRRMTTVNCVRGVTALHYNWQEPMAFNWQGGITSVLGRVAVRPLAIISTVELQWTVPELTNGDATARATCLRESSHWLEEWWRCNMLCKWDQVSYRVLGRRTNTNLCRRKPPGRTGDASEQAWSYAVAEVNSGMM